MTYRGRVKGNHIIMDEPLNLPDGTEVRVEVPSGAADTVSEGRTMYDDLKQFIGIIDDLPPDFALNHDHYIRGAEKRSE